MSDITIRAATIEDSTTIFNFIKDFAVYQKAENEVQTNPAGIEKSLFGENSTTHAVIVMDKDKAIGFAVYFCNYSTWLGNHGIYLEDLFVSEVYRGQGIGTLLMQHVAKIACDNNFTRLDWSVLDWNTPAIEFYQSIGAKAKTEWLSYRLSDNALSAFAKHANKA